MTAFMQQQMYNTQFGCLVYGSMGQWVIENYRAFIKIDASRIQSWYPSILFRSALLQMEIASIVTSLKDSLTKSTLTFDVRGDHIDGLDCFLDEGVMIKCLQ